MAPSSQTRPSVKISLPSDQEIAMTRVFDAPREMVFDALTRPELVKRWFGPPPERGWSVDLCEADVRVGGAWRIVLRNTKGTQMALHGVYREIVRPERFVATQLMEGCDGQGAAEAVATTSLTEAGGGMTKFTNTVIYPSKDVRDAVLKAGGATEESMSAVYDKLAALLATGGRSS